MKFTKGIVKKYSREYSRTLKNGKKKKYKSEQIHITVSKQDDTFLNDEEVLIISKSEKDKLEGNLDIASSLEIANSSLEEKIDILNSEITKKDLKIEEYEKEIANFSFKEDILNNKDYIKLKDDYGSLNEKYDILKKEFDLIKNREEYNSYLANKFKHFILDSD